MRRTLKRDGIVGYFKNHGVSRETMAKRDRAQAKAETRERRQYLNWLVTSNVPNLEGGVDPRKFTKSAGVSVTNPRGLGEGLGKRCKSTIVRQGTKHLVKSGAKLVYPIYTEADMQRAKLAEQANDILYPNRKKKRKKRK